ncbi:AMP-binding protein, partial [Burkholderia cenocepacia]|uniref:AMP-binding protein n=1 Tax=Burkholderia cenocepacia TaxID=95486 RepID=UPI0024B7699F
MLEAMVNDQTRTIGSLDLLRSDERQRVIHRVHDNACTIEGQHLTLHELVEQHAHQTPSATALVYGDQHLSYAELNARANQLAHYLRERGVGPDVLVAICAERSLEMVVALLGVLKAGGAYVPVDPTYPAERIEYMLRDAQPRILLTQHALVDQLPHTQAKVLALDTDWHRIASLLDTNIFVASIGLTPQHLAYVIYTFCSTGKPKGAMNPLCAVVNRLLWMQQPY